MLKSYQDSEKFLLLALVYVATAKLGLSLSAVSGFASFIWLPTGISFAALYLWGKHLTPAVFIGAAVVNFLSGADVLPAILIGGGNALEAWAGVTLFTLAAGPESRLEKVRDAGAFVLVGALLSTMISASIGVGTLYVSGVVKATAVAETWRAWFIGDMLSALVIAPLIIVWSRRPGKVSSARKLEGILLGSLVVFLATIVFADSASAELQRYISPHWVFLFLIWATLRFGQHANVLLVFVVSAIAVAGTVLGHGPYTGGPLEENLLFLQLFTCAVALSGLFFGALGREKEDALRLRTDFVSIASHELRTPLTSLNISVTALKEELKAPPGTKQAEIVAAIERQSLKLNALTESLLNIAQIESGNLVLEKKDTDVSALVTTVTANLAGLFQRTSCELVTEIQPAVRGTCSAYGVEQILTNLMMNSLKYGQGKPVKISLSASGNSAKISVTDQGIGIPEAELVKVFDRYHRANQSAPGVGLGLYISRLIVDAHNGKIMVQSQEGKGSTFTVELPLTPG